MKPFGELEFCDGFLFAATLEDEELCRSVLERILEIPVKAVKVHKESMIAINPEYRGIWMDGDADNSRRESAPAEPLLSRPDGCGSPGTWR